jgi:hypothetical protein
MNDLIWNQGLILQKWFLINKKQFSTFFCDLGPSQGYLGLVVKIFHFVLQNAKLAQLLGN